MAGKRRNHVRLHRLRVIVLEISGLFVRFAWSWRRGRSRRDRADDIAVAGVDDEICPIDAYLYRFALAGFAFVGWNVTDVVLAAKFLGDTLECRGQAAGCPFGTKYTAACDLGQIL